MLFKEITVKEWIFTLLFLIYIGGFGYFWGMSTNDLYLIIVFTFLLTQLIGGHFLTNIILKEHWTYKIKNRYLRLLFNFMVNVGIGNITIPIIRMIHHGNLDMFLLGPVVYGLIFAIIYLGYLALVLNKVDAR